MEEQIRILLIDDSSLVRDLLVKSLGQADNGITILGTAVNGKEGLEKLSQLKPDVVITDMEMPVMNGLDFIRYATQLSPVPIIVLSSWTQQDKQITLQALEAGAVDFMPKPSAMSPQGFDETLARLVVKIKAAAKIAGSSPRNDNKRQPAVNPLVGEGQQTSPPSPNYSSSSNLAAKQSLSTVVLPGQSVNYEEKIPQTIIGVGELAASNDYGRIIKTFALGSCVALNLFSPTMDVVGMAHIALSSSVTSPEKAKVLPGYFADTAIPALVNEMRAKGYRKPVSQILAKITGGAKTAADANNYFKIGEKNIAAVKHLLQTFGIRLQTEDVGDTFSRTVFIQVGSFAVNVSSPEKKSWVI